jgi:hydroxypyruvate reductase
MNAPPPSPPDHSPHRALLQDLFAQAVRAVSASVLLPSALAEISAELKADGAPHRRVILSVGKAAGAMMQTALAHLPAPHAGLVVTPPGGLPQDLALPPQVEAITAGHPTPDAESQRAAERALALAASLGPGDHLLVLLSGGGSALMAAPAAGISLADKQALTRALLRSGAPISAINGVRKHLSRIKGGRLAQAAGDARITTLILSDIPGDDPALVASGPTLPDQTTLTQARDALRRHGVTPSPAVAAALDDPANETWKVPPAGDRHQARIIGRARDALEAAASLARRSGYAVQTLGDDLEGEARDLARAHAKLALAVDPSTPRALISGGETTVTVTNPNGRGGRNLEYLLALALELEGAPSVCALACDTDGIDGASHAAGGMIFCDTLARARQLGFDPARHLAENNALPLFEALGDLIITGPTLTNVNDFRVILIG